MYIICKLLYIININHKLYIYIVIYIYIYIIKAVNIYGTELSKKLIYLTAQNK